MSTSTLKIVVAASAAARVADHVPSAATVVVAVRVVPPVAVPVTVTRLPIAGLPHWSRLVPATATVVLDACRTVATVGIVNAVTYAGAAKVTTLFTTLARPKVPSGSSV